MGRQARIKRARKFDKLFPEMSFWERLRVLCEEVLGFALPEERKARRLERLKRARVMNDAYDHAVEMARVERPLREGADYGE